MNVTPDTHLDMYVVGRPLAFGVRCQRTDDTDTARTANYLQLVLYNRLNRAHCDTELGEYNIKCMNRI